MSVNETRPNKVQQHLDDLQGGNFHGGSSLSGFGKMPARVKPPQRLSAKESAMWGRISTDLADRDANHQELLSVVRLVQHSAWFEWDDETPFIFDDRALVRSLFATNHRRNPVPGAGAALYIDWMLYGGTA